MDMSLEPDRILDVRRSMSGFFTGEVKVDSASIFTLVFPTVIACPVPGGKRAIRYGAKVSMVRTIPVAIESS